MLIHERTSVEQAKLEKNVSIEANPMATTSARSPQHQQTALKPTDCLTQADTELLSVLELYRLVKEGFVLRDVETMLALSNLYSSKQVVVRILGKSKRTIRRLGLVESYRLNPYQSSVAFQYAKALEHAIAVFGTQKCAEEWLGRPCRYLADNLPVDLLDNSLGFKVVEDYLARIELGVYQ